MYEGFVGVLPGLSIHWFGAKLRMIGVPEQTLLTGYMKMRPPISGRGAGIVGGKGTVPMGGAGGAGGDGGTRLSQKNCIR